MGDEGAGESHERAVSEILGTTFIISLSLLSALAIIALGTVAIGGVAEHSEDSLGSDSFEEMHQQLSGLAGNSYDSGATFRFPEGTGDDVRARPDEGTVKITVESTSAYTVADRADIELDLGTIEHESSDGTKLVFQGGALFKQAAPGASRVIAEPDFDYDGDILNFAFLNVTVQDQLDERRKISAQRLAEKSDTENAAIREALEETWQIVAEGTQVGTAPVDITVTFETEYYRGWEAYASNYMSTPPDTVSTDPDENEVTFEFEEVGSEFSLFDEINDFESVVYAGQSQYAIYHEDIDKTGQDQEFELDNNNDYVLGIYDKPGDEGPWAIYDGGNNWEYYPKGEDTKTANLASDFEYRTGHIVKYEPDVPICILEGDKSDMKDAIDDGDCFKQMFGVDNPGSLDPGSNFTIDTVDVDVNNHNLTAEITNEGYIEDEQYILLRDDATGAVVDYNDSNAGAPLELDVDDTAEIELGWHGSDTLTGDHVVIETENDSARVDTSQGGSDPPESEFVITDFEITDPQYEYGDEITVDDIDINDEGADSDPQNVTLAIDGAVVDLEANVEPPVSSTFELAGTLDGVSRTAVIEISTDDDTVTRTVLVDPEPISSTWTNNGEPPVSVLVDFIEIST